MGTHHTHHITPSTAAWIKGLDDETLERALANYRRHYAAADPDSGWAGECAAKLAALKHEAYCRRTGRPRDEDRDTLAEAEARRDRLAGRLRSEVAAGARGDVQARTQARLAEAIRYARAIRREAVAA